MSRYGGGLFDNCLLSDSRIDGFGRYNSLESKLDWTVYRMNPYCNDNGGGGGGGNRGKHKLDMFYQPPKANH